MSRFKFVIVKELPTKLADKLLKGGKALYIIRDTEENIFILFPAQGLHRRKGFRCEKET